MFWRLLRERSRLRAVKQLDVLDSLAEPGFDRFVQLAADAFNAPISLLTLLHDNTLWIKAATGFETQCMPRQDGFCSHVVDRDEPLEVCDVHADPLFRNLPPVTGAPYVRYYIGAPLKLFDGTGIGALCILDTQTREPASLDQRAYLSGLARQATQALERRAHIRGRLAA